MNITEDCVLNAHWHIYLNQFICKSSRRHLPHRRSPLIEQNKEIETAAKNLEGREEILMISDCVEVSCGRNVQDQKLKCMAYRKKFDISYQRRTLMQINWRIWKSCQIVIVSILERIFANLQIVDWQHTQKTLFQALNLMVISETRTQASSCILLRGTGHLN